MSDCYTPTDGEVLEAWTAHNTPDLPTALDLVGAYDAFKRWLTEHDAKVRADEREKCARIAENLYFGGGATGSANRWGAKQAVARIREQGKEQGS